MFNEYPYRNIEDLNLDYLQARVRNLEKIVEQFVALESVTFADPIQWSITSQYAKNVVVLDKDGNGFISKRPVPSGVYLMNEEYWLEVFNFIDYIKSFDSNLTFHIEANTARATAAYNEDDWLLWDDILYKVTAAIALDDLLVIGTNIERFTVEDFCRAWAAYMVNTIAQYKHDIDESEAQYRTQLAGDIASTTATLEAQLELAISGATVDSEVIDARLGADGVTYGTLGNAIRTQLANMLDVIIEADSGQIAKLTDYFVVGNINIPSGNTASGSNRVYNTPLLKLKAGTKIEIASGWRFWILHYDSPYSFEGAFNYGDVYIPSTDVDNIRILISKRPEDTSETLVLSDALAAITITTPLYEHLLNSDSLIELNRDNITSMRNGEIYVDPNNFVVGNINLPTGNTASGSNRVYNEELISIAAGTKIEIASGWRFWVLDYDSPYSYEGAFYVDSPYTALADMDNIRILISKSPEDASDVLVLSDALAAITFKCAFQNEIDDINSRIGNQFPDYYDDKLADILPTIQSHNLSSGVNGCAFIFDTDQHVPNHEGYSQYLAQYIAERTNNKMLILGGDVLTGPHTKAEAVGILRDFYLLSYKLFGTNYRALLGNHDLNTVSSDPADALSNDEAFALIFKNFQSAVISGDNMYYYWDDANSNIRFICLNSSNDITYPHEQLEFLHDTIMSANGSIIVFTHAVLKNYTDENTYTFIGEADNLMDVLAAANGQTSVTIDGYTYDFTGANSVVKFVLSGHLHADAWFNYNGVLNIITRYDRPKSGDRHSYKASNFDCVNVDLTNDIAYFDRFGELNNTTRTFDLSTGALIP